jgi:DNA-binding transcriptional ArsR family regulator
MPATPGRSVAAPLRTRRRPEAFAALGDATRIALVARLRAGDSLPISQLARGTRLSRQAVSKHLRVLEQAGLVRGERHGREVRFALQAHEINALRGWLDELLRRWQQALVRCRESSGSGRASWT